MVLERNEPLYDPLVSNNRSGLVQTLVGLAVSTIQSVIKLCKGTLRRTGGAMR